MTRKIFKSIMAVALSVILASYVIILGFLYNYFGSVQEKQLADELSLAAISVETDSTAYLEKAKSGNYRITWIAKDGNVIYDTVKDEHTMENHSDREEVKQALAGGEGKSVRYSNTVFEKTIYCAKRLNDGSVLRISVSQTTVWSLVLGMLQPLIFVLVIALIISGVLAVKVSKKIVEPLNGLDLDNPLENDCYEELSPLLGKIDRQNKQINYQLAKLKRRKDEFEQVVSNMGEGLVLLDSNGLVLSINPAARKIFSAGDCEGKSFLSFERSTKMSGAVDSAFSDGKSEFVYERNGCEYSVNINRIESDGATVGCVILVFDITQQARSERIRREFSANVSHELKTPLQGIIGSAELIESGLAKPQDIPRFVGHIRTEAQRLVALIEDIIRLSQLDEGGEMLFEQVDLFDVATEVKSNLQNTAQHKDITVSVNGGAVQVSGVRRLIYEIIFNLCDNSIKYGKQGGKTDISVTADCGKAVIKVADNGIGIEEKYKQRIFERFFRIDKSHSKASGGTGLGLSIVKHAVMYHHGNIEVESVLDEGTVITVELPLTAEH